MQAIKERNAKIAETVVLNDLLTSKPEDEAKSRAKIKKAWEVEIRLQHCDEFLRIWNKWRRRTRDIVDDTQWTPKNAGQITAIENAMDFAKEHSLDLEYLIGSLFKAYQYRRLAPNVQSVTAYGLECYAKFADEVMTDLDHDYYERRALGEDVR